MTEGTNERERQPMKVVVEEAKPTDVEGIQDMLSQTWLATYPNTEAGITAEDIKEKFAGMQTQEFIRQFEEFLREPKPGNAYFVAKDGSRVIGACWVRRDATHSLSAIAQAPRNELVSLYVLPDYQKQGVGKDLWAAALPHLNLEHETFLHVAEYNQDAIGFYESLGFKDVGIQVPDELYRLNNSVSIPAIEMVRPAASKWASDFKKDTP